MAQAFERPGAQAKPLRSLFGVKVFYWKLAVIGRGGQGTPPLPPDHGIHGWAIVRNNLGPSGSLTEVRWIPGRSMWHKIQQR